MNINDMALQHFQDARMKVPAVSPGANQRLKEVADDFEALFVKTMLDSMRSTLDKKSRIVDGGFSEEVFEDMLYDEYAQLFSKVATFGISEAIVQQFSRAQL